MCAKTPDNKVHGANMGPTWVLSAPDGPHIGPMNLAISDIVWANVGLLLAILFRLQCFKAGFPRDLRVKRGNLPKYNVELTLTPTSAILYQSFFIRSLPGYSHYFMMTSGHENTFRITGPSEWEGGWELRMGGWWRAGGTWGWVEEVGGGGGGGDTFYHSF